MRTLILFCLISCLILTSLPLYAADDAAARAALKLGNYYLLKQDWRQARFTLRKAIQREPENETLWLAYDNVVRHETGHDPAKVTPLPLSEPYQAGYETELVDPPAVQRIQAELQAAQGDRPVREADFSQGLGEDFSVILGSDLERIDGVGIRFPARRNGNLVLTFDVKHFPRTAKLRFQHRVERSAGRVKLVPLQVLVNEKRLFIRPVRVPVNQGETVWNCTDLLKSGSNVIEVRLDSLSVDYLLGSVRLTLEK